MGVIARAVRMEKQQQYCLKWNNHQNNLLRVFSRLLGQEQFTDVVVAAGGRHVKCHKVSNSLRPEDKTSPFPSCR